MNLNKVIPLAAIGAVLLLVGSCSLSKVDPGHVGVRVSNFGERGVTGEVVEPGRWVWNGPGYQLHEFPTFKQNHVYEGVTAITFGTVEGMEVTAPIGVSYRVDKPLAPKLFQDYRKGVQEITNVDLRNMIQNAFVNIAGNRKIETVYGAGKAQLIADVKASVVDRLKESGLIIEDVYWAGNPILPRQVTDSINAKIDATQKAEQRQNEVATALAEAEKERATAQGNADAQLMRARAEAEAIQIKGEALRQNSQLVELTIAEKWDGKLPTQYLGGDGDGKILQIMQK